MVASSAHSAVRAAASRLENARRRTAPSRLLWVLMVVMGGPSQRPVIGPSSQRQSRRLADAGDRPAALAA